MSSHKTLDVARYVALGAITALTFSVAAHAGDATTEDGQRKTVIIYNDLDLSQDADVRELYSRLRRASDKVCDQNHDHRDLRAKRLYNACYQDALARAVESVGHAAVKAVYAEDDRIRMAGRGAKPQAST